MVGHRAISSNRSVMQVSTTPAYRDLAAMTAGHVLADVCHWSLGAPASQSRRVTDCHLIAPGRALRGRLHSFSALADSASAGLVSVCSHQGMSRLAEPTICGRRSVTGTGGRRLAHARSSALLRLELGGGRLSVVTSASSTNQVRAAA